MLIIPVIDLMGSKVVHALGGRREHYQPLLSQLTSSIEPEQVIEDLLGFYPFSYIYIADLDAIENGNYCKTLYQQLCQQFPLITIWLDAGIRTREDWHYWQSLNNIKPVIGSETLQDLSLLAELDTNEYVLSLDFRHNKLLGKFDLLDISHLWPERTIVMCLDAVGAQAGPDVGLLRQIQSINTNTQLIAAGGVRGEQDIEVLKMIQIDGALIASALHYGTVSADFLTQLGN